MKNKGCLSILTNRGVSVKIFPEVSAYVPRHCILSSSGDAANLSTTATQPALHLLATPTAHSAPADRGFRVSSVINHLQQSKCCVLLLNSEGGFVAVMLQLKIKQGRGQCGERKYSYETDCSHRGIRGCVCVCVCPRSSPAQPHHE